MKTLHKNVLILLSFLGILACHKQKRTLPRPYLCSGKINYLDNCTLNGACQLSFTCNDMLPVQSLHSTVNKMTNFQATSSAQLTIKSITTQNTPALLQTSTGAVPANWFSANSPLDCTVDNSSGSVTCENFAPLADDFEIAGILGISRIVLDITVDSSGVVPVATGNITQCGQFGVSDSTYDHYTTVQRIYDCSKRVTDYAGIGVQGANSTPFVAGSSNPDSNWFLVGCPTANYADIELCAWLAPVVQSGNSTIGINCSGSNCDPTSPNIEAGTRMVWSGLLDNETTYNFAYANGTNNASAGDVVVNCNGNGYCAEYQGNSPTSTFHTMIQTDTSFGFSPSLPNICSEQFAAKDPSFSGMLTSTYNWIVPSYPILLTVSGVFGCISATFDCIPEGFSANSSPIPYFQTSLCSSSLFNPRSGWFFVDGGVVHLTGVAFNSECGVRCVSPAW